MADVHTKAIRSYNMSRIHAKNTSPEIKIRSLVHALGYRYRLHAKKLPGCPDLVFSSRQKVIFVHGCFWHMHKCKYGKVTPKTNAAFWQTKRLGNIGRDKKNQIALKKAGWKSLTIWECELRKPDKVVAKLRKFLSTKL
ncbi:MAG: very short patch repair endonuclease [Sedimentisphaerales bacterium]|nr:very short patch repair endonuclease [Sedimentisphaerales bacterium]